MAATIDTVAQRCLSTATAVESTIYYVLEGEPGVSVAGAWRGPGMRGNCSAPMSLDQVELGADRALTPPGKGLDLMLGTVLPEFQVGTAAVAVGIPPPCAPPSRTRFASIRPSEYFSIPTVASARSRAGR
jgi:alkylation response protein AidB-like acyl-CoA dehydrogenase